MTSFNREESADDLTRAVLAGWTIVRKYGGVGFVLAERRDFADEHDYVVVSSKTLGTLYNAEPGGLSIKALAVALQQDMTEVSRIVLAMKSAGLVRIQGNVVTLTGAVKASLAGPHDPNTSGIDKFARRTVAKINRIDLTLI